MTPAAFTPDQEARVAEIIDAVLIHRSDRLHRRQAEVRTAGAERRRALDGADPTNTGIHVQYATGWRTPGTRSEWSEHPRFDGKPLWMRYNAGRPILATSSGVRRVASIAAHLGRAARLLLRRDKRS